MSKGEDRSQKVSPNPTLPKDEPKMPSRLKVSWFMLFLAGLTASIVVLIDRVKRMIRSDINLAKHETKSSKAAPKSPAPDDDPKIFNLPNFGWFALALVAMIAFVLVYAALLSGFFLPGLGITVPQVPTVLPPQPRLQPNPALDFQALHATQEAELNSYGWVDQSKGIVHIPIDRAMELLAQQNLPVVQGTPVPITPEAP